MKFDISNYVAFISLIILDSTTLVFIHIEEYLINNF